MPDLKPYRIGLQLVSKNEGCEDESGMLQLEILARDTTAAARLGVHTALRLSGETLQGKLEVSLAPVFIENLRTTKPEPEHEERPLLPYERILFDLRRERDLLRRLLLSCADAPVVTAGRGGGVDTTPVVTAGRGGGVDTTPVVTAGRGGPTGPLRTAEDSTTGQGGPCLLGPQAQAYEPPQAGILRATMRRQGLQSGAFIAELLEPLTGRCYARLIRETAHAVACDAERFAKSAQLLLVWQEPDESRGHLRRCTGSIEWRARQLYQGAATWAAKARTLPAEICLEAGSAQAAQQQVENAALSLGYWVQWTDKPFGDATE